MEVDLSFGAVAAIWEGEVAREMPLVLQVLVVRTCSCPKRPEPGWCHAALSDGAHLISGHMRLDETASAAFRAAPRGYGAVVRLLDFETRTNIEGGRSIDSEHVEVLHTSLKIGDPKTYRPGYLIKKHEKLDAQLVTSSPKQNFRANPIGQGLKQLLISGVVAMLQHPVMQVVGVSLLKPDPKTLVKYHLILADGVHTQNATLHPRLNHLVEETLLRKGTIVCLLDFVCCNVRYRRPLHVELEVLQTECVLIGNPTFYELGNKQSHSNSESFLPISGSFCKDQGGMEMQASLTWGAVAAIWEDVAAVVQPVLQVFDLLVWAEMDDPWLSPILLSDGTHLIRGSLSPYIISSSIFRDGRLHMGAVVRLLEFTCHNDRTERVIVVLKLEVLRADCLMVGNPKQYPSGKLENKREELDTESVSSNAKLNCEAYSAGQCLKEFLTRRGMVTTLQQPMMQVVDVSLMTSSLGGTT